MNINALLILFLALSSEAVAGNKIELTSGLELNLDAFVNANIIGLSHQEKGLKSQLSIGRLIEVDSVSSLEKNLSEQGFEIGEDCSSAKYFYYLYPETLMRVFLDSKQGFYAIVNAEESSTFHKNVYSSICGN